MLILDENNSKLGDDDSVENQQRINWVTINESSYFIVPMHHPDAYPWIEIDMV